MDQENKQSTPSVNKPSGLEQMPVYKPRKRKKWLIILFIIIALGIIAGVTYIFMCPPEESEEKELTKPEENESVDWKFYRDVGLGVQMKYPAKTTLAYSQENDQECINLNFPTKSTLSYCMGTQDTPTGKKSSIKIDGNNYDMWHKENKYEIPIDEKRIIFVDQKDDYELFEKVIATFEFIEVETLGWKVYKNTDIGFEVKYPNELEMAERRASENLPILIQSLKNVEAEFNAPIFKRSQSETTTVVNIFSVNQSINDLLEIFRAQIENEKEFTNKQRVKMNLFDSDLQYYLIDKNPKTIIFIIESTSEEFGATKILSSFNFIE